MNNKQNSVEWLWSFVEPSLTDAQKYFFSMIIEEAKAMHKEEMVEFALTYTFGQNPANEELRAYCEKLYNETFGGNNE